jgi:cholesterol transport system auxiliary component
MNKISALLLMLLLSGCVSLFPKPAPPPQTFSLTPKNIFPKTLDKSPSLLTVERPHANAGIDTDKISVLLSPYKVDYYTGARWVDRSTKMIKTLIVESFENSNKITAIAADAANLRSDYMLLPEIREFQAETFHDEGTMIHIGVAVKLIKMPERRLVVSEYFDRIDLVPHDSLDNVVQTFDESLGKILKRMVIWTISSIN